jgi:hypothetical protein
MANVMPSLLLTFKLLGMNEFLVINRLLYMQNIIYKKGIFLEGIMNYYSAIICSIY